jgi:GxxExxY protein
MEVYKIMGNGFLEAVYQECLELELAKCGIPFEAQKRLTLMYDGRVLKQTYISLISSAMAKLFWRSKPSQRFLRTTGRR